MKRILKYILLAIGLLSVASALGISININKDNESIVERIETIENQMSELFDDNLSIKDRIDILLSKDEVKDSEIDSLENDIVDLLDKISILECEIQSLESDNTTLKTDVETLKTDVETLKTDIKSLKEKVNKKTIRIYKSNSTSAEYVDIDFTEFYNSTLDGDNTNTWNGLSGYVSLGGDLPFVLADGPFCYYDGETYWLIRQMWDNSDAPTQYTSDEEIKYIEDGEYYYYMFETYSY